MKRIPIEQLKQGYLYEIDARNQSRGIWIKEKNGFEIARKKFNQIFLFVEYDYETGAPFGTATPYVEIEKVPDDILEDGAKRLKYLLQFDYPTSRQLYTYDNGFRDGESVYSEISIKVHRLFVDMYGFDFTKDNWK